jgi:hypothetical protein
VRSQWLGSRQPITFFLPQPAHASPSYPSITTPSTTDSQFFRIRLASLPSKRRSSRDPIALVSVPGNGKQPLDKL